MFPCFGISVRRCLRLVLPRGRLYAASLRGSSALTISALPRFVGGAGGTLAFPSGERNGGAAYEVLKLEGRSKKEKVKSRRPVREDREVAEGRGARDGRNYEL